MRLNFPAPVPTTITVTSFELEQLMHFGLDKGYVTVTLKHRARGFPLYNENGVELGMVYLNLFGDSQ